MDPEQLAVLKYIRLLVMSLTKHWVPPVSNVGVAVGVGVWPKDCPRQPKNPAEKRRDKRYRLGINLFMFTRRDRTIKLLSAIQNKQKRVLSYSAFGQEIQLES
jgi:hypothetical protein